MQEFDSSLHTKLSDILSGKIECFSKHQKLSYNINAKQIISTNPQALCPRIIKLSLSVKNNTEITCITIPRLPRIQLNFSPDSKYLFPEEPTRYSMVQKNMEANYGGRIHFPFVCVKVKDGKESQGLIIGGSDKNGTFKKISVHKEKDGLVMVEFAYDKIGLKSKQSISLPDLYIGIFNYGPNFIKSSIQAYKELAANWLTSDRKLSVNPYNSRFNRSFLLRVIQLYEIQWHQSQRRVKSLPDLELLQLIKQDQQKVGTISFVHLRDWSAQKQSLKHKFGNYLKQTMVGPLITKQWLKCQIGKLKERNIGVGLYFQGYLISKQLVKQEQQKFKKLQMLDSYNKPFNKWGSTNYVMCSSDQQWQSILVKSVQNVANYLEVDAVYLDQFGFGFKTSPYKTCTNPGHSHNDHLFDLQIGQLQILQQLSTQHNNHPFTIYIECTPNDSTMQYAGGSFSRSAWLAAGQPQGIPILLSRFIFPEHKIYELVTEYSFGAEDLHGEGEKVVQDIDRIVKAICIAFWNGNGIYLPKNLTFYNKRAIQIIRICNSLYHQHQQLFNSPFVQPLHIHNQTRGIQQVLGNKFASADEKKWLVTLINLSQVEQEGCVRVQDKDKGGVVVMDGGQKEEMNVKMEGLSVGVLCGGSNGDVSYREFSFKS